MAKDKGVILTRNVVFPTARFLTEAQQEAYEQSIQRYSGRTRKVLDIPRKGSNLFKVLYLDQMLPEGERIATPADWQDIRDKKDYLVGLHLDAPEVVLRSAGDSYKPNDFVAKDLAKKIHEGTFKNPIVITGLKLRQDSNSSYGFVFELTDKSEKIEAPEFAHSNNGREISRLDERGFPIFDDNQDMAFYTRDNGLSRLYLSGLLSVDSSDGNLEISEADCRVVVVSAEGRA